MEWKDGWKDKVSETIVIGVITFIGSWLVKKAKKSITPINEWAKGIKTISKTKNDSHYTLELVKMLLYLSSDPMWVMTIKGEFESGNKAWCELVGFEDDRQALYMGFMRCIPDDHADIIRQRNKDFAEHPVEVEEIITLKHIVTGKEFEVNCITKLIYDENKKPIKLLGKLETIKL